MRLIKKIKGFTLVELIVVIAIIGILSAVLVPSYMYFVEKANFSADQQDARNMTTVLKTHLVDLTPYEIDNLEAPDIVAIVNMYEKNYTFKPRSSKWSFWYNEDAMAIEVSQNFSKTSVLPVVSAAPADFTGKSIEEVKDGYLLLDTKGNDLAYALNLVRNLQTAETFPNFTDTQDELVAIFAKYGLQNHITQFHPDNTLYINAIGGFTTARDKALRLQTEYARVNKVVFASGLKTIPNLRPYINGTVEVADEAGKALPIKLPVSVQTLEKGSLSRITSASPIVASQSLQVETDSLSTTLATQNARLVEKDVVLSANSQLKIEVVQGDSDTPVAFQVYDPATQGYITVTEVRAEVIAPTRPETTKMIMLQAGQRVRLNVEEVTATITGIDYSSSTKIFTGNSTAISEDHIRLFDENGLIAYIVVQYQKLNN
jgi:type IV pilus assembly protein PilA